MLSNIMIGKYYPVKSSIHKMNPLAKVICTVIFIAMCFLSNSLELQLALLLLLILMIFNTKVPIKIYLKAVYSLRFLLIFVVIINFIFKINYIETIILLCRLIFVVIYTTILTLTTPPVELTYGFEKLLSPFKLIGLPVNKMAFSICLSLRFIPTIISQGNKILKSQSSRGVDYYNSNLSGKWLAIKTLVIPMFILSLKNADELSDAMEIRLYNVNKKRTNFRQNKWGFFDTYLVLIHLLILGIVISRGVGNEIFNNFFI